MSTQSGATITVTRVIEIGLDSTPLNLGNPARLLLAGDAGQHVGFTTHGGPLTEITFTCTSNSISTIPSDQNECKINVGNDLVVWADHFSSFATWV